MTTIGAHKPCAPFFIKSFAAESFRGARVLEGRLQVYWKEGPANMPAMNTAIQTAILRKNAAMKP